ncbi:hypothetical protein KR044_002577, partial [Drosophila immigrans]
RRMLLLPSESFSRIMRFVRVVTSLVGCDPYDKYYRVNRVTAFTLLAIIVYSVFTFSTVIRQRDWMFGLQASVLGSFLMQGVNKMYVGIRHSRKIYDLNLSVQIHYEEFEKHEDPRFATDLLQSCHRLRRVLIIVGVSYMIGISGMVFFPISVSFFTDKFILIMHFHIPYVDVETEAGAWVTQVVHAVTLSIGAVGLYAGDMVIIVHLLQPYMFVDILRLKIDIFNQLVKRPQSELKIQLMLVDMMQFHQEYLKYIARCNDLFYSIVSIQVISAASSIIMTMFVVLTSDWPGGYFFVFVLLPNLYIYCVLGTLVENCNDDIMCEAYNISFYNLNARQQRQVLFMLCKTQSTDMIQLLGVMPLAVSTGLKV